MTRHRCRAAVGKPIATAFDEYPSRSVSIAIGVLLLPVPIVGVWVNQLGQAFGAWIAALSVFLIALGVGPGVLERLDVSPGRLTAKFARDPTEVAVEVSAATQGPSKASGGAADALPSFLTDPDELRDFFRFEAADSALRRLLGAPIAPLEGWKLHLYLWDDGEQALVPTFEEGEPGSEQSWPPGVGVVGTAFQRGEFVLARAPETYDGTFGLSPALQGTHSDLLACAAMPVCNWSGSQIAILSASLRGSELLPNEDSMIESLNLVAEVVARVLIDLLGWFDDGAQG